MYTICVLREIQFNQILSNDSHNVPIHYQDKMPLEWLFRHIIPTNTIINNHKGRCASMVSFINCLG